MSAPPITRLEVPDEEEAAIRAAVRNADVSPLGPTYVVAGSDQVAGLVEPLSDPQVSDPIYDLPRPFTTANIAQGVADAKRLQDCGGGDARRNRSGRLPAQGGARQYQAGRQFAPVQRLGIAPGNLAQLAPSGRGQGLALPL